MQHTFSPDVVWFNETTHRLRIRPPRRYSRLLASLLFMLIVLVRKLGLLFRTYALDPGFGDLFVGQLLHTLQSTAEEPLDCSRVVDT